MDYRIKCRFFKKSQISFEFMLLITLGFLILIGVVIFSTTQAKSISRANEETLILKLADKIKSEINLAKIARNGYSRDFNLPQTLSRFDYTITKITNTIILKTNNLEYEFIVHTFQGTIKKEINTIKKQNEKIIIK